MTSTTHHTGERLYDFSRNETAAANRGGRPASPREHGSQKGYDQHRYYGESPCGRCLYAHQTYVTGATCGRT